MSPRVILFASPMEPSGASWLLNCFLELGIRIAHKPIVDTLWRGSVPRVSARFMWEERADGSVIKPKADVLKKWLPALTRHERFHFRSDVEIEYVQDVATGADEGRETIFFVRDARDALYSMFRRVQPELSFEEYLDLPNPQTLLDRPAHWALHVRSWREIAGIRFFRFEDYKADAAGVLRGVLATLNLPYGDDAIERAVAASTSEQARAAEAEYRRSYPQDNEVANRAGRVGDWRAHADAAGGITRIERTVGSLLRELGYAVDGAIDSAGIPAHVELLAFLRSVKRPATQPPNEFPAGAAAPRATLPAHLVAFAERLDSSLLRRSRLPPDEVRTLLDSLVEATERAEPRLKTRLLALRGEFEDGSDYHFERLRALLAERRRAK